MLPMQDDHGAVHQLQMQLVTMQAGLKFERAAKRPQIDRSVVDPSGFGVRRPPTLAGIEQVEGRVEDTPISVLRLFVAELPDRKLTARCAAELRHAKCCDLRRDVANPNTDEGFRRRTATARLIGRRPKLPFGRRWPGPYNLAVGQCLLELLYASVGDRTTVVFFDLCASFVSSATAVLSSGCRSGLGVPLSAARRLPAAKIKSANGK